jgi:hypothetical protein
MSCVTRSTLAYRLVSRQRPRNIQQENSRCWAADTQQATANKLLEAGFSVVLAATFARQRRCKHASEATVEPQQYINYFLRGPCRGVINGDSLELTSLKKHVPGVQDLSRLCSICYQETSGEDWRDFICAVVTVIFGVYNLSGLWREGPPLWSSGQPEVPGSIPGATRFSEK